MSTTPQVFRSVAQKKFPKIISFDAFDTLYNPKVFPLLTYHEVGQRFGIQKKFSQIKQDFVKSFKEMELQYPNYGLNTNILNEYKEFESTIKPIEHASKAASEHAQENRQDQKSSNQALRYSDNWWGLLIKKTFAPFKVPHEMTKYLIEYYSGPGYEINRDLKEILQKLRNVDLTHFSDTDPFGERFKTKDDKVLLLINSNGDPRVKLVLSYLGVINEDLIPASLVYFSYDTKVQKPNKESFDYILKDLINQGLLLGCDIEKKQDKDALLQYCWHFGDKYSTDLLGSINAGWHGILIDRQNDYQQYLQNNAESGFRLVRGNSGSIFLHDDKMKYIIKQYKQLNDVFGI